MQRAETEILFSLDIYSNNDNESLFLYIWKCVKCES